MGSPKAGIGQEPRSGVCGHLELLLAGVSFLVATCCLHNQEKQGAFRGHTHWVTALESRPLRFSGLWVHLQLLQMALGVVVWNKGLSEDPQGSWKPTRPLPPAFSLAVTPVSRGLGLGAALFLCTSVWAVGAAG